MKQRLHMGYGLRRRVLFEKHFIDCSQDEYWWG